MYWRIRKTPKALTAPGMIRPQYESSQPCPPLPKKSLPPKNGTCLRTRYVGISVTCPGIIIVARNITKILSRPGKRRFANA